MSELQSSALHADQAWMKQATVLALQGLYSTKPNPNVGCVMVKDGLLLGTGITLKRVSHMQKFLRCAKRANRPKAQRLMSL